MKFGWWTKHREANPSTCFPYRSISPFTQSCLSSTLFLLVSQYPSRSPSTVALPSGKLWKVWESVRCSVENGNWVFHWRRNRKNQNVSMFFLIHWNRTGKLKCDEVFRMWSYLLMTPDWGELPTIMCSFWRDKDWAAHSALSPVELCWNVAKLIWELPHQ